MWTLERCTIYSHYTYEYLILTLRKHYRVSLDQGPVKPCSRAVSKTVSFCWPSESVWSNTLSFSETTIKPLRVRMAGHKQAVDLLSRIGISHLVEHLSCHTVRQRHPWSHIRVPPMPACAQVCRLKIVWLPCWAPRGQQVSHQRWTWGIHCTEVTGSILVLKPSSDITRSPKQDWRPLNFFLKKVVYFLVNK